MALLADECIAGSLIKQLRASGFDVLAIAETSPGMSDDEVLGLSVTTGRFLVTEDYDFADLIFRFGKKAIGVIIIAPELADVPGNENTQAIAARVLQLSDQLVGKLTVLEMNRNRQRELPE
jgi:predicted nuclease of predicted toxin-antitoxin system